MNKKGNISVNSENIFPIIKKFLYSDNEVFLRELVANAVDAVGKLKHLASIGEYDGEIDNQKIKITVNKTLKTITIEDKGIGMSAQEIEKYCLFYSCNLNIIVLKITQDIIMIIICSIK